MVAMVRENYGHLPRPRMLLAYSDSAHAARCVRYFRRLGWEVHMVASGVESQRLAAELLPHVIVLDADLPDESCWLCAAKLGVAPPEQFVVILVDEIDDQVAERARSLSALGVVRREDSPEALAALVLDQRRAVAV
jgi:CheY-like chemotaxis protein